jgi:hypothetical protein
MYVYKFMDVEASSRLELEIRDFGNFACVRNTIICW